MRLLPEGVIRRMLNITNPSRQIAASGEALVGAAIAHSAASGRACSKTRTGGDHLPGRQGAQDLIVDGVHVLPSRLALDIATDRAIVILILLVLFVPNRKTLANRLKCRAREQPERSASRCIQGSGQNMGAAVLSGR